MLMISVFVTYTFFSKKKEEAKLTKKIKKAAAKKIKEYVKNELGIKNCEVKLEKVIQEDRKRNLFYATSVLKDIRHNIKMKVNFVMAFFYASDGDKNNLEANITKTEGIEKFLIITQRIKKKEITPESEKVKKKDKKESDEFSDNQLRFRGEE